MLSKLRQSMQNTFSRESFGKIGRLSVLTLQVQKVIGVGSRVALIWNISCNTNVIVLLGNLFSLRA